MKKRTLIKGIIFIISCLFNIPLQAQNGTLVFTEIFYDSPLNEWMTGKGEERNACHEGGEYIELYNPTLESVDVTNWQLKGMHDWEHYEFPAGTIIAPKEIILLSYKANPADTTAPLKKYLVIYLLEGYFLSLIHI